jgi:hypothetical protein
MHRVGAKVRVVAVLHVLGRGEAQVGCGLDQEVLPVVHILVVVDVDRDGAWMWWWWWWWCD